MRTLKSRKPNSYIIGLEKTKQKLNKNKEQVESLLNEINLRNTMLYEISNYIFTRNH